MIQYFKDYVIYWHGCPTKIQKDGRRLYASDAILRFWESFGNIYIVTAAYYPQSNGKTERVD